MTRGYADNRRVMELAEEIAGTPTRDPAIGRLRDLVGDQPVQEDGYHERLADATVETLFGLEHYIEASIADGEL